MNITERFDKSLGLVGVTLQDIFVHFTYENELFYAYIAQPVYPLLTAPFAFIASFLMLPG